MYLQEAKPAREKPIPAFNTLQAKGKNEFNTLRGNFTLKRTAYGNLCSVHACQLMAHLWKVAASAAGLAYHRLLL